MIVTAAGRFLIAVVSGLVAAVGTVIVHRILTAQRAHLEERLADVTPTADDGRGRKPSEPFPFVTQVLESSGYHEGLRNRLAGAGLAWRPSEFAVLIAVSMLVFFFIGISTRGLFGITPQISLLIGLALGLFGFALPQLIVVLLQIRRRHKFESQLADALSLAAASVRAGFTFLRALQVIVEESEKPITTEFATVLREVKLGASVGDALQRLADRMRSADFDVVVTAVLVHLEVGGNLTEILEIVSRTIRERRRIRGEIKTLTAQGRLSGWIVGALPFVIFGIIAWLNPTYLKPLFTERSGLFMVLTGLAMQIVGIISIRRIVSLDI